MTGYRAAWVREDAEDIDYLEADALGARWVLDDLAEHGGTVAIVTGKLGIAASSGVAPLLRYGNEVTPRTERRRRGLGPVLAYRPDAREFELAESLAHGSSLCVIEGYGFPVRGWAARVGAFDIVSGSETAGIDPARAEYVDRIIWYGNNGWTRGFGADNTARILSEMKRAGVLDRDEVLGVAAAEGKGAKALQRLEKLIDRA